jgi:hypothetical protein
MGQVENHYDNLLAKNYTRMFGTPFVSKVAEQKMNPLKVFNPL